MALRRSIDINLLRDVNAKQSIKEIVRVPRPSFLMATYMGFLRYLDIARVQRIATVENNGFNKYHLNIWRP